MASSTAAPLPLPQPVQPTPLDLALQATANIAKTGPADTAPATAVGAASSSQSAAGAAANAGAIVGFSNAAATAQALEQYLSPAQQTQAWSQFTAAEQAQLKGTGYKPPGHEGFFGQIASDITNPIGDITHPSRVYGLAMEGFHDALGNRPAADVLNALGAPLRTVQHLVRTVMDVEGGNAQGGTLPLIYGAVHSLNDPSDWFRAWQQTSNGEGYIQPSYKYEAIKRYGGSVYSIALQLAEGKSPQSLIAAAQKADPSGAAAQALAQQISSPQVAAAVQYLNGGHLSPGRSAAHMLGLDPSSGLGAVISGGVDGVEDIVGDPLNYVGGAGIEAMAARYAIRNGDDLLNLYSRMDSVHRAMENVAETIRKGLPNKSAADDLLTRWPQLRGAADTLVQAKATTPDEVANVLADLTDYNNLALGRPVSVRRFGVGTSDEPFVPGSTGRILQNTAPHVSALGLKMLGLKHGLSDVIDMGADVAVRKNLPPEGTISLFRQPVQRLEVGVGKFARQATTTASWSKTHIFNPNDPNALEHLRNIALYLLPRKETADLLDKFATNPELGARWDVYRSIMVSLGKAAGLVEDTPEWDAYIGKYASTEGRLYSTGGRDLVDVGGTRIHAGVTKQDMDGGWLIPNYRDLSMGVKRTTVSRVLTRAVNNQGIDTLMGIWRPLTLLRLGFATRVGGEEAANYILRAGIIPYMKGQAGRIVANAQLAERASQAAKDAADMTLDEDARRKAGQIAGRFAGTKWATSLDDVEGLSAGHLWQRLAGQLPTQTQNQIETLSDLVREYVVDMVQRAKVDVAKSLAGPDIRNAVQALIDHGALDPGGAFEKFLTANHGFDVHDVGRVDGLTSGEILNSTTGKLTPAQLRYKGTYAEQKQGDPLYWHNYKGALDRIASDDWAREALITRGNEATYANRIQVLAEKLQNDPMWKLSRRAFKNRNGGTVGQTITEEQAARDHAEVIVHHVNSLIRSPDGKLIDIQPGESLASRMLKEGRAPTLPALQEMPASMLPRSVSGPEMQEVIAGGGSVRKITDWTFQKIIGPQINWISRKPIFIANYASFRKGMEDYAARLADAGFSPENVEDIVHTSAQTRAIDETIRYVHNPELRSQMSLMTRNLAPFWFAQEQFYKRWGRAFLYSPAAFRKAQLANMGLRHSGFVHTDPETGQEYFVYPGSAAMQDVLSGTLSKIFPFWFGGANLPIGAALVGQPNMLNPGLERLGLPSFGPMVMVPLDMVKQIDPHMTAAVNAVQGPYASGSGYLQAIFPSSVAHVAEAIDPSLAGAQYASAMMDAIQAYEASGHGIGEAATTPIGEGPGAPPTHGTFTPGDYWVQGTPGAPSTATWVYQADGTWRQDTPHAMQTALTRIRNWTRVFYITRLAYGFTAPTTPENLFDPGGLHSDMLSLMNEMPFTEAVTTFLHEHPDATAETVFQTTDQTGGFLPSTQAAMKFLDDNKALVDNYPQASTYLIPQPDTSGKFDLAAYQEQLAEGLRQRRTPQAYYDEILYQAGASDYFALENAKNLYLASNPGGRRTVDDAWTQFSEGFMAANPVFQTMYNNTGETSREEVMTQIGQALQSGAAPPGPQTSAATELYDSYVTWQSLTQSHGNPNQPAPAQSVVNSIDQAYASWLAGFVQQNPGMQPLVDRAIRPDLTSAIDAMAAAQTPVAF